MKIVLSFVFLQAQTFGAVPFRMTKEGIVFNWWGRLNQQLNFQYYFNEISLHFRVSRQTFYFVLVFTICLGFSVFFTRNVIATYVDSGLVEALTSAPWMSAAVTTTLVQASCSVSLY